MKRDNNFNKTKKRRMKSIKKRRTSSNYSKNKNQNQNKNKKGGEVIDSGGFGCVFRPALKCKGVPRENSKISKLMSVRHAEYEYGEITQFLTYLQLIPNYQNYFLVTNVTVCDPDELTEEDLEHYHVRCGPLKKLDINAKNINKNLDKLKSLNLPDGGMDIRSYVESEMSFSNLNQMLMRLLLNGIIPMNQMNIYHGDVKASNILIGLDNHARLIDWGLSSKTDGSIIPNVFYGKPFQYNLPISCILFNDVFLSMYDDFKTGKQKSVKALQSFVRKFINEWNEKKGEGHLNTILKFIKLTTGKGGMTVIISHISNIILTFGNNENWVNEYFKNIFLKNADIWGWIIAYSPVLEKTNNEALKGIFNKYLYEEHSETKEIDAKQVIEEMKTLSF